jgi:hypothetical protein
MKELKSVFSREELTENAVKLLKNHRNAVYEP